MEEGTHDDLYAMNGIYHGLVDAQNLSAESDASGKAEHSAPLHDSFTIEAVTADTDPSKDYTAIASSGVVEKKEFTSRYLAMKVSNARSKLT